MLRLVVVENPKNWELDLPGVQVVSSREYFTEPRFMESRRVRVFNMCRSYRYQSVGYYVSLLAEARRHRPLPSVSTLQDLRLSAILRVAADDLEDSLQRAFAPLQSDHFVLSIYFGRNLAKRYDRISQALFDYFPAPFLRAEFTRTDQWQLQGLRLIATREIPESHRAFVNEQAQRYFSRTGSRGARKAHRYDLAILVDPEEADAPSDATAIRRFARAAESLGMRTTLVGREDHAHLAEYDALFIRETTRVNHHTYRFSSRAEAEGMVVIDDPGSILRCTNKVYQAELFARNGIPSPPTIIVHRENMEDVGRRLGFPCVLKKPDSYFSLGVMKAETPAELASHLAALLGESELVVAQPYTPSEFDWRVGVLDRKPLFVCKYFMAKGHWQIQKAEGKERRYGKTETLAVDAAPPAVVELAVRTAGLVGDGFYGVDLKEIDGKLLVIEINDNPSVESGVEDVVLKDVLYRTVMQTFLDRLERRGRNGTRA
jgi:glutathione synthase/RimK-type ligase-like ATP-grasp enzyme